MRDKTFFRTAMSIAVPVSLQSMLQSSFSMVDQLMVGQLGAVAVSAVEVGSRPNFLFTFVVGAVATAAGIMISQYLGMRAERETDQSISVNLIVSLLVAGTFMAVCLGAPSQIVSSFVAGDIQVVTAGSEYLTWISWTYIPAAIASILAVYVRCIDKAALPLVAGLCAAVLNTFLNYVLIFGNFGAPALGVSGAAIASVVSQLLNVAIMLIVFCAVRRGKKFSFSIALGKKGWKQYAVMLLPVLITEGFWSLGQNVNTYIYGHMPSGSLAAYSMTGAMQGLFIGALVGLSQAAGILIGKRLGADEYAQAYQDSEKVTLYGIIGAVALACILALVRGYYVRLYNVDTQVQQTSAQILLVFALLLPFKVSNMILGGGVLRSGGKTAYIMGIDLFGTWAIGVPLGLFTAFVVHLPVVQVYFWISTEEIVRLLITVIVFRRKKWMQRLDVDPSQV